MSFFGTNLKSLRTRMGLTQSELANVTSIHASTIRKWENGECEPGFSKLNAICAYLQVSQEDMLNNDLARFPITRKP